MRLIYPTGLALALRVAGHACALFPNFSLVPVEAASSQEVLMLRSVTLITILIASLVSGSTGRNMFSPWKPTNLQGIRFRWQADELDPPACVVQLDRASYASEPIRVLVSYLRRSGQAWQLSVIIPPQMTGAELAQQQIEGCVSVSHVEAAPLGPEKAKNSSPR